MSVAKAALRGERASSAIDVQIVRFERASSARSPARCCLLGRQTGNASCYPSERLARGSELASSIRKDEMQMRRQISLLTGAVLFCLSALQLSACAYGYNSLDDIDGSAGSVLGGAPGSVAGAPHTGLAGASVGGSMASGGSRNSAHGGRSSSNDNGGDSGDTGDDVGGRSAGGRKGRGGSTSSGGKKHGGSAQAGDDSSSD